MKKQQQQKETKEIPRIMAKVIITLGDNVTDSVLGLRVGG